MRLARTTRWAQPPVAIMATAQATTDNPRIPTIGRKLLGAD
jgi:hypothetical protein